MKLTSWDDSLRASYPPELVNKMLDVGAELPTEMCPPWWRPFARRRWIRRMCGRIAMSRVYGWRTNKGNARHHTHVSKYSKGES